MKSTPKMLVAVAIGLIASIVFWAANGRGTGTDRDQAVTQTAVPTGSNPAGTAPVKSGDRGGRFVASSGQPASHLAALSPNQIVATSRTAQAALDQLLPMAQSGDPDVVYALQRVYQRCLGFIPGSRAKQPQPTAPENSPTAGLQQQVIERNLVYCADPRLGGAFGDQIKTLKKGLVDSSSERVISEQLMSGKYPPTEASERAISLLQQSRDPQVIEKSLVSLAEQRISNVGPQFGDEVFPQAPLTKESSQWVKQMAAKWMACEMGSAYCSPYASFQEEQCLYFANCASHLSIQDFIRSRALSAQQFELMLQYIDYVKKIQSGVKRYPN